MPDAKPAPQPDPKVVRRIKTYSSELGTVYQYQFYSAAPASLQGVTGNLFKYYVSVDRKNMFTIQVFIHPSTAEAYQKHFHRPISGTEEYAVAKMRLFQAFDEDETLASSRPTLTVDASNIDALLAKLDLE
jgi:hypothetical protein